MKYRVGALVAMAITAITSLGLAPAANAVTTSPIRTRYDSDSALRAMLGSPTNAEFSVAGGRERDFRWGSLYWNAATGVHEVHGAIRYRYRLLGGPAGKLGFPATDEKHVFAKYDFPDEQLGARNDFANGAIEWVGATNKTIWMGKAIAAVFPFQTYPYWGIPDGDQRATNHNGQVLTWPAGRIYGTPTGAFTLDSGYPGDIWHVINSYLASGAENGPLGLPTSDLQYVAPTSVHPDGVFQTFQGGAIYQRNLFVVEEDQNPTVHIVRGAIYWAYSHHNGLETLGFPTTEEQAAPGGRISYFQHGRIFWNALTNKTTITLTP